MTYEEAKKEADRLWKVSKDASDALNALLTKFPKGPMGLTPAAVKQLPEYQKLSTASDKAFQQLRAYNAWYTKQFKKEIQKDRANRYRT